MHLRQGRVAGLSPTLRHAKSQLRIERLPSIVVGWEVVSVRQESRRDAQRLRETVQGIVGI